MTAAEPRRIWRMVNTYVIDGGLRLYLFDNSAPEGPHLYLAPSDWFWGKAGAR